MTPLPSSPDCPVCKKPLVDGPRHAGGRPRVYCGDVCKRQAERQRRYGESSETFEPVYTAEIAKFGDQLIANVQELMELVLESKDASPLLDLLTLGITKHTELVEDALVLHLRANGVTWEQIGAGKGMAKDAARHRYKRAQERIDQALGNFEYSKQPETPTCLEDHAPVVTVVQVVNELLEKTRMSKHELAKRAQVSVSHVSRILSGDRSPSSKVVHALLRVLLIEEGMNPQEPAALHELRRAAADRLRNFTPTEIAESLAILRAEYRARDVNQAVRSLAHHGEPGFLARLIVELKQRQLETEHTVLLRAIATEPRWRVVGVIVELHDMESVQITPLFLHIARNFSMDSLSLIEDLAKRSLTLECSKLADMVARVGTPTAISLLLRSLTLRGDENLIALILRGVLQYRTYAELIDLADTLTSDEAPGLAAKILDPLADDLLERIPSASHRATTRQRLGSHGLPSIETYVIPNQ